jgi:sulfite reductase beta subunit-like hemoprotein
MVLRSGAVIPTKRVKGKEVVIMGINTPKKNRNDETTADQNLVDGLGKHASTIPAFVVGGATVATKDIATALQARIATAKAATTTRATWQSAVQADRDERTKTKTLVSVVKQTLLASFAGQIDTLADFGLTPRKPRVVTPEEKVAAAAKAKATRAARHTMGKKQKAGITGTVAPTSPAPTAPSAPTPNPTPPAAPAPTPVSPAPAQAAPSTSPATATSPAAPPTPTHVA